MSLSQQGDKNSANAQKKASKKAAAKAKKEAMKAGGGGGSPAAKGAPAPAAALAAAKIDAPPAPAIASIAAPVATPVKKSHPPPTSRMAGKVQPLQLVINPNSSMEERPTAALSVAILTNTVIDYEIISDHLSRQTCLGLEDGFGVVVGDAAMARYIIRRANSHVNLLGGTSPEQQALVDAWVDYALSLTNLPKEQRILAVNMSLEHALSTCTYLVGSRMSLADICVFCALGFPCQLEDKTSVRELLQSIHAKRWMDMMASSPALQEATQLAVGIANDTEAIFDEGPPLEPLANGMNLLQGATPGRVVTRFPPEPSGYLHIGHAKAALLNDYYARRYRGRLIVRFDDTNPSKEKEEFQEAIVEDLAKLGVVPDIVTYTSDYFETLRGYAEYMITNGLAFMDDTPQEQMKEERMEKKDSKHRNQSPQDAMKYFKLMCSGKEEGSVWCLRAKINMQSLNGTMRDPVMYRQNLTPHHRSGTRYKAYPTYDLACPVVDSLEGVTHALRTTEYNDRDEQYQWFQTALKLRRNRIHGFARMNFVNTVLSKRKLTWFVENGYVTGWDDPRFPTVRGVVRRGLNITALHNFMYSQGASRRIVNMVWSTFWAENKKEIDKQAKRFMAIDKEDNVTLTVTNAPDESENALLSTAYHPKDPSLGKRVVCIAKKVLLETVDVEGVQVGEHIVLMRWGEYRNEIDACSVVRDWLISCSLISHALALFTGVVKITKVDGGLEGEYVPDGDFKAASRKLTWLAAVKNNTVCVLTEFDNLVTKDKLDEEDKFEDFINPNTLATTEAFGDPGLKALQEHDVIQLERRGYYRVDRPYIAEDKPIILFMVPDGKEKAMSGLAGKLAHR